MDKTMSSERKIALAAGILYLITFVSIPTLILYGPVHSPNYVTSSTTDTPALIGVILEWIVALAGIGTAVALYPIVKKQNQGVALGFIGARVLEASTIFVGIGCILSIVTLRQVGASALITSHAFIAMYDSMFLIGQSLIPAINALLLGYLLFKSRLVPRVLPILGFIGSPLLIIAQLAIMFGYIARISAIAGIAALPIALWEFSLGVWLTVKGFNKKSKLIND